MPWPWSKKAPADDEAGATLKNKMQDALDQQQRLDRAIDELLNATLEREPRKDG